MIKRKNDRKIVIYGAGRAGRIIKEILELQNEYVLGFIDDELNLKGTIKYDIEILGDYNFLKNMNIDRQKVKLIISIAAPQLMKIRDKIFRKLIKDNFSFINAIHPSVYISSSVSIGINNFISPGVIIEAGTKLGDNNRICINTSIDHDCVIGNSNFIGAHTYISSCCNIENKCSIDSQKYLEPFTKLKSNSLY